MSATLEENLAEIVRKVIREELGSLIGDKPETLMKAEDVRHELNLNNVQKVYALVREGEIEPIWISRREMRFAPSTVKEFQLRKGIKLA